MFDRVLNTPLILVNNKEVENTFTIFALCAKITRAKSWRHFSIVITDFEQVMSFNLVSWLKLLTAFRSNHTQKCSLKNMFLKILTNFRRKHIYRCLFFNTHCVKSVQIRSFSGLNTEKKKFQDRCFAMSFTKFITKPFL